MLKLSLGYSDQTVLENCSATHLKSQGHNPMDSVRLRGKVIPGYQRGGKELGFPTANLSVETTLSDGVYCGRAVLFSEERLMVMSIGHNPHYGNQNRSVEVHILHTYEQDFYGEILEVQVCHHLRDMSKFDSVKQLISAIEHDITLARQLLT